VGRKDDLEHHICESYDFIRQYEEIERTSDRPPEKARARREIEEQWRLVKGYIAEYQILCQRLGKPLAEDIMEIVVTLDIKAASVNEGLSPALSEAVPQAPQPGTPIPDLTTLRRIMVKRLSEQELEDICFDLGEDYESLVGQGKAGKIRELVLHLQRRERIPDLVRVVTQLRPDIKWG
jgi:hypothetical protein